VTATVNKATEKKTTEDDLKNKGDETRSLHEK
jgi:hypothetical protein